MKITKLSLVAIAAMTITTGAMAEVTMDLSGNVKLWYETADSDSTAAGTAAAAASSIAAATAATGATAASIAAATATANATAAARNATSGNGLFHQNASGFTGGDAAVSIEAKGKAGVLGYGFKYTAVDTLGLENDVVSSRRTPHSAGTPMKTAHWAEKAFITYKMGNTTAKIGRQHLNTPLAFTEAWNVSANSFDAAVLMNSDITNVTLVGAYVGRGNGGNPGIAGYSTVQANGEFNTYVADGAYAAGVLAKPVKDLGVNAWYYNVKKVADAAWVDADYKVGPVKLGAVYAQMMPKAPGDDTTAFAVKAGSKVGPVSLFGAYSKISDKGTLHVANTATGFKKTKLPTAGVYNDGVIVAAPGAETFKVKAVYPIGGVKLIGQYVSAANDVNAAKDVDEIDVIVATKIADVNVKAIFINRTFKNNTKVGSVGSSDSNHVRIIAGINF